MFKKLVIKEEYASGAISFPHPMDKIQDTGINPLTVVYYDGNPEDLYLGTDGDFGAKIRYFSLLELSTLSEDFLKYFDVVDYELTDEDVELAKEKVKEEDNPLGNLLISLLEIAEELVESLEESLEDVDVDEPKYQIVLPHISEHSAYLNYEEYDDTYYFDDKYEVEGFKTQFTQSEIDELFPEYDVFKVEVSE